MKAPPDRIVVAFCPNGHLGAAAVPSQKGTLTATYCYDCPGNVPLRIVRYALMREKPRSKR